MAHDGSDSDGPYQRCADAGGHDSDASATLPVVAAAAAAAAAAPVLPLPLVLLLLPTAMEPVTFS